MFDTFSPGSFDLQDPSTLSKSTLRRCAVQSPGLQATATRLLRACSHPHRAAGCAACACCSSADAFVWASFCRVSQPLPTILLCGDRCLVDPVGMTAVQTELSDFASDFPTVNPAFAGQSLDVGGCTPRSSVKMIPAALQRGGQHLAQQRAATMRKWAADDADAPKLRQPCGMVGSRYATLKRVGTWLTDLVLSPGRADYKYVYMAACTERDAAFPFQSVVKVDVQSRKVAEWKAPAGGTGRSYCHVLITSCCTVDHSCCTTACSTCCVGHGIAALETLGTTCSAGSGHTTSFAGFCVHVCPGCFVGEAVFVPRRGPSTLEALVHESGGSIGNGNGAGISKTNGNGNGSGAAAAEQQRQHEDAGFLITPMCATGGCFSRPCIKVITCRSARC